MRMSPGVRSFRLATLCLVLLCSACGGDPGQASPVAVQSPSSATLTPAATPSASQPPPTPPATPSASPKVSPPAATRSAAASSVAPKVNSDAALASATLVPFMTGFIAAWKSGDTAQMARFGTPQAISSFATRDSRRYGAVQLLEQNCKAGGAGGLCYFGFTCAQDASSSALIVADVEGSPGAWRIVRFNNFGGAAKDACAR